MTVKARRQGVHLPRADRHAQGGALLPQRRHPAVRAARAAGYRLDKLFAEAPPTPPPPLTSIQLAGQRVVFAFAGTAVPRNLRLRIRRGEAAGVLLFGANVSSIAQVRATDARAAGHPAPRGARRAAAGDGRPGGRAGEAAARGARRARRRSDGGAIARGQGRRPRRGRAGRRRRQRRPRAGGRRRAPGLAMEDEGRSFPARRDRRAPGARLRRRPAARAAWPRRPSTSRASARRAPTPTPPRVVIRTPLAALRARDAPPFDRRPDPLVMTVAARSTRPSTDQPAMLSRRVVTGELRRGWASTASW